MLVLRCVLSSSLMIVAGCSATPGPTAAPARWGHVSAGPGDPIEPLDPSGCASPYARICGEGAALADARAVRHKAIIRDIERATLEAMSAQLGLDVTSRERWQAHLAQQPAERRELLERLAAKLRAIEITRRVAPLEPLVRAELERLRAVAIERLRSAARSDAEAVQRVERAALAWIDLSSARGGDPPRPLRIGCGEHLLVDDAWVSKDAQRITLCPGFLLVSQDPSDLDEHGFHERIAFLVAHELGHVALGPTPAAHLAREAEIRADALATEIVAADLAARDDSERGEYLRRALEPICAPEGDHSHPPGQVRVEEIVARHPVVAAVLECDAGETRRTPSGGQ